MKKIVWTALFLAVLLVLAACGESDGGNNSGAVDINDINMEELETELDIPETADSGDELTLKTLVTQGDEKVDDASEVIFEVWVEGNKDDSDMIEADLPGEDGIYSVTYEFTEEAVYNVQPHVTARGSHVMPVEQITIGDPVIEENEHDNNHNGNENQEDHSHGHLHESLTVDWESEKAVTANEETTLIIETKWEEEPWTDGEVQFEIWKHGDEQHDWIDAQETEPGTYEAEYVFEETGDYHVVVHLEDDHIHEHIQYTIESEE